MEVEHVPPCTYTHVHPHVYGMCIACVHPGKIYNFNALVGVLLSDVPERLSGELCV